MWNTVPVQELEVPVLLPKSKDNQVVLAMVLQNVHKTAVNSSVFIYCRRTSHQRIAGSITLGACNIRWFPARTQIQYCSSLFKAAGIWALQIRFCSCSTLCSPKFRCAIFTAQVHKKEIKVACTRSLDLNCIFYCAEKRKTGAERARTYCQHLRKMPASDLLKSQKIATNSLRLLTFWTIQILVFKYLRGTTALDWAQFRTL